MLTPLRCPFHVVRAFPVFPPFLFYVEMTDSPFPALQGFQGPFTDIVFFLLLTKEGGGGSSGSWVGSGKGKRGGVY